MRFFRIAEACAELTCGETKLREYVRSGKLELVKIGAASRITGESIERLKASLPRKRWGQPNEVDNHAA